MTSCGARHHETWARCTIMRGHDADHQAYWRDRLIHWPANK